MKRKQQKQKRWRKKPASTSGSRPDNFCTVGKKVGMEASGSGRGYANFCSVGKKLGMEAFCIYSPAGAVPFHNKLFAKLQCSAGRDTYWKLGINSQPTRFPLLSDRIATDSN